MDATRARRTRDRARQAWYARHRQWRFARFLGFLTSSGPAIEQMPSPGLARAGSLNTTIILALERASFSLDPGRVMSAGRGKGV
jgi:hypothetical protein